MHQSSEGFALFSTRTLSGLLLAAAAAACAGVGPVEGASESTAGTEEALVSGWVGFTPNASEANPNGVRCPGVGQAVTGARCQGGNCTNMALYCVQLPGGLTTSNDTGMLSSQSPRSVQPGGWTRYISEESGAPPGGSCVTPFSYNPTFVPNELYNAVTCDGGRFQSNSIIDGISALGSNSDCVSIHCSTLDQNRHYDAGACTWTAYFSEESGGTQLFPNDRVATGVRCRNGNCDDLSFYVCPLL